MSAETENVYKIAATFTRVRGLLVRKGWEFQGKDEDMDSFKEKSTGRQLHIEDISEDFQVTFLMGDLTLEEFSDIARQLTPGLKLLVVESSWEGEPTTIIVAMTEDQVKEMFGRGTKMRQLPAHSVA